MKRNYHDDQRNPLARFASMADRDEMDGLIELGMKDEALRLARLYLRQNPITVQAFNKAIEAIRIFADRLKAWANLVESAYERLPRRELPAVRCFMMSFYWCRHDHAGVMRLMPERMARGFSSEELVYALEAAIELDKTELVTKLAKQLPYRIRSADNPVTQALLLDCMAEILARKGRWNETIAVLECVQFNEALHRNAVEGIVEVNAVRAWLALRQGFQLMEQFNRNFDPETELIAPGNDKSIQQDAAKEFRRLQRILEKIVPEKRRKELGIK